MKSMVRGLACAAIASDASGPEKVILSFVTDIAGSIAESLMQWYSGVPSPCGAALLIGMKQFTSNLVLQPSFNLLSVQPWALAVGTSGALSGLA